MNTTKIKDVCVVVSGTTPKSTEKRYWNGTHVWITPAELTEDSFIVSDSERHITDEAVKATGLKPFPKGTVLLSSRAPIGKVAIAGCDMYCNQGFKNLICSDSIYNLYLYYFLKSKTEYLNSLGRGATFKEISKGIVEDITIPFPAYDEQIHIAKQLQKITELIALKKRQYRYLDDIIRSRFLEMFGNMIHASSDFREMTLEEVCRKNGDVRCGPFGTQLSKSDYLDSGVPVWGIPEINSGFQIRASDYISKEKANLLSSYSIISGDIVMSRKGNVGKCEIYPSGYPVGIMHSDVLRIRVNKDLVNPTFLKYQFHFSERIKHQIDIVSHGAIMAGINVTKLKNINVLLPAINRQNQFSEFIHQVDKSKMAVQKSLDELETLKKSLMQTYFG